MAETATQTRRLRKQRKGTVVSRSGDKSIVVSVERRKRHPLYGKIVRVAKRYHVHDEANAAGVGDEVRITETRPLSKTKRWRVVDILSKAAE
jgi:small subunit ribosomal protein S17